MLKGLVTKKMIVLYLSMAIIGFLIGYDYALLSSRNSGKNIVSFFRFFEDKKQEKESGSGRDGSIKNQYEKRSIDSVTEPTR